MHAPPVIPTPPHCRPVHGAALLSLLLVGITSPALVQAQTQTKGQWSPIQPDTMTGVQVHVGLVRGDGSPFHSRVVWAGAQAGHVGVLGWKNDGAGCNSFPDTTLATGNLIPIPFSAGPPSQNLFCGGWSVLGSPGELVSVGGSDATLEGLRDVLTYNPAGGISGGTWTSRTSMGQHRWYPTVTPLRDPNRMLVTAGHKYDQMWSYCGRRDGAFPTGDDRYLVDRCGRIPRGNWDPSVVTIAASALDGLPPPREGHTLAYMHALNAPFMFGGRDGADNPVPNDVWYLTRENGGALGAEYQYPWTKLVVPTLPRPGARSDHIAVAASANDMIVFGGLTKVGGTETLVPNDVWRLNYDSATLSWTWTTVAAGGTPPSARFGHTAVYDEHKYPAPYDTVRRLIVFGGTTLVDGLSDHNIIHVFTFDDGTFSSGSWATHTPTGTKPSARYDHTMTLTPYPWGTAGHRLAWVYGGRDNTAPLSDPAIWRLRLDGGAQDVFSWQSFTPDPDSANGIASPGPRAGHAAIFDPVIARLSFIGGSATDQHLFQLPNNLPDPLATPPYTPAWERGQEAADLLSNHAVAFDPTATGIQVFARIPEIYDRGTVTAGGGTWTSLDSAGRKPDYYPVQFLVPRTPFRADTCRVLEVGQDTPTRYLDIPLGNVSGAGPWNTLGHGIGGFQSDPLFHASSGVMYRPGKILIAGGIPPSPVNPPHSASKRAARLDVVGTVGWVPEPDMAEGRYYHNLVLLPTGGVVAIGGLRYADTNPKLYDSTDAVLTPEYWEPGANGWVGYAPDTVIRNYHSTAILMPDGKVLIGGGWGGQPNDNPPGTPNPNRKKLQLFCPPYLFDASGNLATDRPVIVGAPETVRWRQRFTVCLDDTTGIRSACLIRPGATTHSVDMNQRFVPLTIEGHAGSGASGDPRRLFLTAPASPDSAPPGDYLLFVLRQRTDGSKVPSVARWVRVQATGDDLCDVVPPGTITDVAPEIIGPTEMWFTWTARADDGEISVSGPADTFDLRGHTIPLDNLEAWDSEQVKKSVDESLPAELGSWASGHIDSLLPCTSYHFGVRARDDHSQDGGFASASFQTSCDGGGSGYSAHQTSGREEGGGGAPATSAPAGGTAGSSSALSSTGRSAATTSSAGSLTPTTGLLVVDTRREGEQGWRVTLTLRETPAGSVPSTATITVEQSGAGGDRDTLGRFEPSAADNLLGLCSLRERGRLGIPGVHRIERVVPSLKTRTGDHALVAASHSRLGSLGPEFIASGGGVEFALGDSLVLIYMHATEPLADAASWYVLVRRTGEAPPIPMGSQRGRLGEPLPSRFALHQNRPNPFRGTTVIAFDLPVETPVTLEVFDLLGRRVAVLTDATYPAGRHSIEWGLRDLSGTRVRPGVYVYRLSAGAFRDRRKMNVLE